MSLNRVATPSHLSARNTGNFELSRDRLTVSYRGLAQHENDVGMAVVSQQRRYIPVYMRNYYKRREKQSESFTGKNS